MDFISIVREKASAIAVSAVKTSGVVVETVKSNFAIADKEQEILKTLKELGELIYKAYQKGEDFDADAVAKQCVALDGYYEEVKELQKKIKDLKNLKTCPSCKTSVKEEHNFCPNCGTEFKDAPKDEPAEEKTDDSVDELNP